MHALGEHDRLRKGDALVVLALDEDAAVARDETVGCHLELPGHRLEDLLAKARRRLDGRVAGHDGHAGRVRAEIDGRQVGVGGEDADVLGLDAENLGDQIGQDRVRALADIRGTGEHGHEPAPVGAHDDARVRHVVPVDGRARPRHVRRARDADAASRGQAPALLTPARGLDHPVDALAEPDGGHGQVIGRLGEGLGEITAPHVRGIETELLGRLVDLALHGKARLRRPVAALGAAGRLVGKDPRALELVDGHLVGHGLERARVEGRGDAVGAVGAAVEPGAEVHARDGAILGEAGLDPHEHRVAPTVDVEHFLAGQGELHRPPRELRELARGDLVGEGIELPPEAATDGGRHHPDVGGRHVEDLGEHAVNVVRRLGRGPQRELAVRAPVRDRGVLLHGQMRVALEEEGILTDEVGGGEGRLHVAELEGDGLVDVGAVAVLVDAHVLVAQRLLDGHEGLERLVVDLDQLGGALGRLLVHRGHRGHRVADHPDLLDAECLFILRHGQDAELHARQVVPGDDGVDAGQRGSPGGVYPFNKRMGVRAAEQLAVGEARQDHVVGELGLAGDLGPGIDLGQRLADDRELAVLHTRAPLMRRAANSTASRILVYPVHRQRLPARATRTSSRVGVGFSARSASAVRRMPGVQ